MGRFTSEIVALLLALLALAVSGMASYSSNDKQIEHRVTAVEIQQQNDTKALDRVEDKIDRLNNKIDRMMMFWGAEPHGRGGRQ